MTFWIIYQAILHLMALGFIAWVIGWLSWTIHWRNKPAPDEGEILAAETSVYHPSYGWRIVK